MVVLRPWLPGGVCYPHHIATESGCALRKLDVSATLLFANRSRILSLFKIVFCYFIKIIQVKVCQNILNSIEQKFIIGEKKKINNWLASARLQNLLFEFFHVNSSSATTFLTSVKRFTFNCCNFWYRSLSESPRC